MFTSDFHPEERILVLNLDTPEEEAGPFEVLKEAQAILTEIKKRDPLQLVFYSKERFWFNHLRISDFSSIAECMNWANEWRSLLRSIEKCPCRSLAIVSGGCEGLGFELALACQFRFSRGNAYFSLQNVRFGHFPVGGSLHRLLSLLGTDDALRFILLGPCLNPFAAKDRCLIDGIFEEEDVFELPRRDFLVRQRNPLVSLARYIPYYKSYVFRNWRQHIVARFRGHFRGPLKLLDVLERSSRRGYETRAQIESEAFAELIFSSQAHLLATVRARLSAYMKDKGNSVFKIQIASGDNTDEELKALLCLRRELVEQKGDLQLQRVQDRGILYSGQSLSGENFVARLFSPIRERKIVEISSSSCDFAIFPFAKELGKIPVHVKKGKGEALFSPVVRLALAVSQEAQYLLLQGNPKELIESAWRDLGLHPSLFELWRESSNDQFYAFSKSFFEHCPERFFFLEPEAQRRDIKGREEMQEQILARLLLEGLLLLQEGILENAFVVDLVMIYGLGFPRYQGGLLYQIDTEGIEKWYKKMYDLCRREGKRFTPPVLLIKAYSANKKIYDYPIL